MRPRKIAALAAISLIASSSAAVAQTAQPLSLANAPAAQRVGAPLEGSSELRRGAGFYLIGAVVLGLIVWGIIELTDDDSNSP